MGNTVDELIVQAKEGNHGFLDLKSKNLTEFPSEICLLTNLRVLDISDNKIKYIPSDIQNLAGLVEINANGNQIESIPPELGKLKKLKRLLLQGNPIQQLPSSIRTLKLEQIDLQGSKLGIPPEILSKTSSAVSLLDYYFSNETLPLREAKVILVGQGSVGKTSLVNRLVSRGYNPQESKTNGIGITKWQVDIRSEKSETYETINLNIWDFGGQEIMHATHQFFLTKRSLYLLVCNARTTESDNKLDYWLKIIRSFGGDSPVIVVGNKIDEHSFDIDRRGLFSKYPQVKAIIDTSCVDQRGIIELKNAITREIAYLPHIFDLVPKKWFDIKDRLSASGKSYLPYGEYMKICKKEGILSDIDQHTLIGFLHDLGTMIYFQDDPRLQELGVLNPEWVTNGVYQIINSNSLFQTYGVLGLKDLETILPSNEYSRSHYAFLIDIMQKFELCYPFDNDANQYLIPDLLRKDEPDTGDWDNALTFQYEYSVLPSSVLSRFIVRMHPFISKNTVWRSGVVLLIDDRRVKVKADYDLSIISIGIEGDGQKRDVLQQIRSQLKAIHETIPGLEVTEKVPISGHPDISVPYKLLLDLESRKDSRHFVYKLNDYVDVRKLLDGVVSPTSQERQYPPISRPKIWKSILTSPKHLGRFALDIFGRSEAKESTAIIVGWLIILIAILIWKGVISIQTLETIWRFFFPVK